MLDDEGEEAAVHDELAQLRQFARSTKGPKQELGCGRATVTRPLPGARARERGRDSISASQNNKSYSGRAAPSPSASSAAGRRGPETRSNRIPNGPMSATTLSSPSRSTSRVCPSTKKGTCGRRRTRRPRASGSASLLLTASSSETPAVPPPPAARLDGDVAPAGGVGAHVVLRQQRGFVALVHPGDAAARRRRGRSPSPRALQHRRGAARGRAPCAPLEGAAPSEVMSGGGGVRPLLRRQPFRQRQCLAAAARKENAKTRSAGTPRA